MKTATVIHIADARRRRDERSAIIAAARDNVARAVVLLDQGAPADRVRLHLLRAAARIDLAESGLV
jgi:hypothetical protein